MRNEHPRLLTSGDIARKLDADLNRVRYLLAHRGHIRPVGRAGLVRLYDESAVNAISEELRPASDAGCEPPGIVPGHPARSPA